MFWPIIDDFCNFSLKFESAFQLDIVVLLLIKPGNITCLIRAV